MYQTIVNGYIRENCIKYNTIPSDVMQIIYTFYLVTAPKFIAYHPSRFISLNISNKIISKDNIIQLVRKLTKPQPQHNKQNDSDDDSAYDTDQSSYIDDDFFHPHCYIPNISSLIPFMLKDKNKYPNKYYDAIMTTYNLDGHDCEVPRRGCPTFIIFDPIQKLYTNNENEIVYQIYDESGGCMYQEYNPGDSNIMSGSDFPGWDGPEMYLYCGAKYGLIINSQFDYFHHFQPRASYSTDYDKYYYSIDFIKLNQKNKLREIWELTGNKIPSATVCNHKLKLSYLSRYESIFAMHLHWKASSDKFNNNGINKCAIFDLNTNEWKLIKHFKHNNELIKNFVCCLCNNGNDIYMLGTSGVTARYNLIKDDWKVLCNSDKNIGDIYDCNTDIWFDDYNVNVLYSITDVNQPDTGNRIINYFDIRDNKAKWNTIESAEPYNNIGSSYIF